MDHADKDAPFLRYTKRPTSAHTGWLIMQKTPLSRHLTRFFRLENGMLSSYVTESARPIWKLSLAAAHLATTPSGNKFQLSHPPARHPLVFHAASRADFRAWVIALRRALIIDVDVARLGDFYAVGAVIGDGANGDVLHGHDFLTEDAVAIKSLPHSFNPQDAENALTEEELQISLALNHPNLVRTFDAFRDMDAGRVHMVMDFVPGGELQARVDNDSGIRVCESDAQRVARDLLNAIEYLHARSIVHRDIKLENVLCHSAEGAPLRVKLADFGSSTSISASRPDLNSEVGTGYYLAPELIRNENYGPAVDLWALGVLLYIVLSNQLPFPGMELEDYHHNVLSTALEFPVEEWKPVSQPACEFITALMNKEPAKRMTASEALAHAWVKAAPVDSEIHDDVQEGTESFLAVGPLGCFCGRRLSVSEIIAKRGGTQR